MVYIAQGPSLVIMAKSTLKFMTWVPKIILSVLLAKNEVKQAEIVRTAFKFFINNKYKFNIKVYFLYSYYIPRIFHLLL